MEQNPRWRRYLRLFGRDVVADVREELQFHLQSKIEELQNQGWPAEQARKEAYRQFGDIRGGSPNL